MRMTTPTSPENPTASSSSAVEQHEQVATVTSNHKKKSFLMLRRRKRRALKKKNQSNHHHQQEEEEQREGLPPPPSHREKEESSSTTEQQQQQVHGQRTAVFSSYQATTSTTSSSTAAAAASAAAGSRHSRNPLPQKQNNAATTTTTTLATKQRPAAAASILLPLLWCGGNTNRYSVYDEEEEYNDDHDDYYNHHRHHHSFPHLPEDPTVEESIECVFAHQLEHEGQLPHLMLWDYDEEEEEEEENLEQLQSPATLLQSRGTSRSYDSDQNKEGGGVSSSVYLQQQQQQQHSKKKKTTPLVGSLVHVGTYDPTVGQLVLPPSSTDTTRHHHHHTTLLRPTESSLTTTTTTTPSLSLTHYSVCCSNCLQQCRAPSVSPDLWPQRPLYLRPTPGSGTRCTAIRFTNGEYLWRADEEEGLSKKNWYGRLQEYWQTANENIMNTKNNTDNNSSNNKNYSHLSESTCAECMMLPINNGNEPRGRALVTEFESQLFRGVMLARIRGAHGTTRQPYDDTRGYFCGMNRRYQIVIRGQFKESIPWTHCVAGMELERPCGKLPPKWMCKSALKVLQFFAPQLQARLDGDHPTSVTPLGSTPQMLSVDDATNNNDHDWMEDLLSLEDLQKEPVEDERTLLGRASTASASLQRARARKRALDKLFVQQSSLPLTDPSKIYTAEFLQHLLNAHDLTMELGSMLGSIHLKDALDGQPMQIMAKNVVDGRRLWAFDVWNECLVEDALRHDGMMMKKKQNDVVRN